MLDHLLSEYQLGNITLKNRVVMAPMTRSRAEGNVPNDMMVTYYGNRAGAGLIITEGTSPSFNGLGYPRIPGNFSAAQMEGWKKVVDAVHANGGKIYMQLMHCGRVSHPDNLPEGGRVLAPSAVEMTDTQMYVDGKGLQPIPLAQEMTLDDITFAVKEYASSAKLAIDAGFDGVELHAANGYLLEQFINPQTNLRTDQFGGSVENRLRFVRDVTEATVAAIGADRVGMRVSPYGFFNEIGPFDSVDETYVRLTEILNEIGIVYLHMVDHEAMGTPPVPESIKHTLRDTFKNTFILSGGYDAHRAEKDLAADKGDLVAFGRPFIANPDLVERFQEGAELNIPNQETFYTPGPEGYLTYPTLAEKV
ncbi:N-ethylmaleimide reductase [Neolewinella xylanilytica]|uniref:N-ethylmaleimide reductase n=1 Tax=Neolewinella xylanilytica TaxID=1514080 RepID=A0A2S6I9Q3_9BACT|nr:alkene reductase [Neolewinella xylanilytica]PPK88221.1 N-ethylmaleimide reductase [Neolewinella xylanilytica]